MNDNTFIEDLLQEAELKERQQTHGYFDLLIMDVAKLESEISVTFEEAEKEAVIIKDWALNKCSKIQERIDKNKLKLEAFIREQGQRTIDLPHGTLKIRKMPDKVEVLDLDKFLANAKAEMLTIIPEQPKANLKKIKAYITKTAIIPKGINIIEGKDEFKLTIKKEVNNDNEK